MNPKHSNFLSRIIKDRAERTSISEADIRRGAKGEPQFLRAADQEATVLFVGSTQEVLRRDLSGLVGREYPGPNCIMPYEIDEFRENGITTVAARRISHAQECTFCSSLLSSLEPSEINLEAFLRLTRRVVGAAASVAQY
jgi:hypothetical protein